MNVAGNVVLMGFMGTGKSTIGRLLADRLRLEWVDTDGLIESRHGPIAEIFAASGEEAFRDMERAVAAELADRDGLVISTGGRLMLDPDNAALLGEGARVFCLAADPDEVLRRVSEEGKPRPLLEEGHPAPRIAALLAERQAGYAQFEQVATDGMSVTDVVDDLIRRLIEGGQIQSSI